MYKIFFCFFVLLFVASGCAGKQGVVNVDQTVKPSAKMDYGIHKAGSVLFGTLGQVNFSGRPNSLSYYAYSVDVNLKNIQESVAHKVLSSIYDDVSFSGDRAGIYSRITNFSYSWELSFASKPDVSFNLTLYYVKDNKRVMFKKVSIKDFNGDEEKTLLGGAVGMILGPIGALLGSAANKEPDKRSQLVTNATVKAVYEVYKKELPAIARLL